VTVQTMKLSGGPFDGAEMDRPGYRWQKFIVNDADDEKVVHRYRPTRDPGVWKYEGPDTIVWSSAA
jgi:hypothetical protein